MTGSAFDALSVALAGRRTTRRGALVASVAGALGLSGVAAASAAQEATPVAGEDAAHPMFLFVQLADAGNWRVSADDPEIYELTLQGVSSQVAFFSDRPERIVGTTETAQFLDALGFTPVNPPNAAAVVRTPEGERDVLVIELFDPVYTRSFGEGATGSLTYRARVLDAYHGDSLVSWYDEQDDPALPEAFDQVTLFIDDCPDATRCVLQFGVTPRNGQYEQGPIPGGPYRQCFDDEAGRCYVCGSSWEEMAELCNATYPDCMDRCWGLG